MCVNNHFYRQNVYISPFQRDLGKERKEIIGKVTNKLELTNLKEVEWGNKEIEYVAVSAGVEKSGKVALYFEGVPFHAPYNVTVENASPGGDKVKVSFISGGGHCKITSCVAFFKIRSVPMTAIMSTL